MTRRGFLRSLPRELATINTSRTPKFQMLIAKTIRTTFVKVLKAYFSAGYKEVYKL